MNRAALLAMTPRYAAICGVAWMGSMFLWMTPFLFSAVKQNFNWSTVDTAYLISALLMTGGVGLLLANVLVRRLGIGTMAVIGAGLEVAGLLAMILTHGFWTAMAGATCAGLGSGLVMSCTPRIAARLPTPERAYALAGVTNTIMAAACFTFIPALSGAFGPRSVLWLHLAMICALLPLVMLGLRHQGAGSAAAVAPTGTRETPWAAVCLMIFGHFLYSLAMGSYWAYIGPAAQAAGIRPQTTGTIVSVATMISLAGPLLAVWMGVRFGRTLPLTAGKLLFGLSAAATLISPNAAQYAVAITLTSTLIPPIIAFESGAIVRLDSSSRGANVAAAIGYFLNGAGSVLGALLMGSYGLLGLAVGVAGLCLLSAISQIKPLRLLDRTASPGPEPIRAEGPTLVTVKAEVGSQA